MTITTTVKALRPDTDDTLIGVYMTLALSIDECLSQYNEELKELTQALLIAHLIEQSTTQGAVTSEATRTGASASYSVLTGQGLASTRFGQQLLALPTVGCVQSLVKSGRFARSIMPCR